MNTNPEINVQELDIKYLDNNILYYKIIGVVKLEHIKIINEELKKAIIKTGVSKIITNTIDMSVISKEAQEYNNQYLIPLWEQLGIKYNALILSTNAFGQWSAQTLAKDYKTRAKIAESKNTFQVEMFDSLENALNWISSIE